MVLVAGLGNPGAEYSGTRHNVGYRLIEKLADRLSVRMKSGKGAYLTGRADVSGKKMVLLQPTTFINNSGDAVRQAVDWFKISPENCLVCYDDLNLDAGAIRMRRSGSAGGHNGIKDVIQKLSTNQFPRLRIGIGNDFREGEQINYVLSGFTDEQLPLIEEAVDHAADAVLQFLDSGMEKAMNDFN